MRVLYILYVTVHYYYVSGTPEYHKADIIQPIGVNSLGHYCVGREYKGPNLNYNPLYTGT